MDVFGKIMTTTAAFLKGLPHGKTGGILDPLRQSAFQYISDSGFPTHKDESWKYTRVAPILEVPFQQAQAKTDHCLSTDAIDRLAGSFGEIQLIFINGRFAPTLSSHGLLPRGVRVTNLASILSEGKAGDSPFQPPPAAIALSYPPPRAGEDKGEGKPFLHAFTALNTALTEDGAFIQIPENTIIDQPIHLVFLSDVGRTPIMSHPRSIVLAGAKSRATIVEVYTGVLDHPYFTNTVTDIILDEGAEITHYKVQNEAERAFHIALLNVQQGRGSRFTSHGVALGAALARQEVNVALTAPNAHATLNGLYLPRNGQYLDHPILIDHIAPHCTSHQFYKGIIEGAGRGGFYGRVIVRPGAMKTDANQTNKNLLLSESAQVDTRPRLEIFADDVKCAHGAAVGQLDEKAVFYLCSRGIPEKAARGMLTYAFANEMVERIALIPLRSYIKQMLASRFSTHDVGERA
jgi:Fe-S cluster assembly protein SufD